MHVHVAWNGYVDLNWEIYYRRLDQEGWGPGLRLTTDTGLSEHPTIVTDNSGNIHIFWDDNRGGNFAIYQKTFGGTAWGADVAVTGGINDALSPSAVAADDSVLHVVWYASPGPSSDIYHMEFDGAAWGPAVSISGSGGESENPAVAVGPDGEANVVWHDGRHIIGPYWPDNFEIYWRAQSTLPKPEITYMYPDHAMAFADVHIADLAGANFFEPVKVWLQRAGEQDVQATNEMLEAPNRISCDFDLRYVAAGDWSVVVENLDSRRDTLLAGFAVQPLPWPQVYSVEPDSGLTFTVVNRTITGINFTEWVTVWLEMEGEADIESQNLVIVSSEEMACDFDLMDAEEGYWDIVVQNPDLRSDTLVAGFWVAPQPPLEMISIEPNSGTAYERVHITDLLGNEFDPDASVWLEMEGENDARAKDLVVESPTRITCDFSLTSKKPGLWDVVVQNPDGRKGILPGGFEVLPSLWEDEVQLTYDGSISYISPPGGRSAVIDAVGDIHVVWSDRRDGNYEIYYKRSNGSSWTTDLRLTNADHESANPAMAIAADGHLHVVWEDLRDGDYEIYHKEFDGSSWGADLRLTEAAGDSRYPSIAAYTAGGVCVAWQDKRGGSGTQYIYFREHDGSDWLPEQPPTPTGPGASRPALCADSYGNAHVAWYRNYTDDQQICYHLYDGISWDGFEILADANAGAGNGPTMTIGLDDQIHVAWQRYSLDTDYGIFYRRFDGLSWLPVESVSEAPDISFNPSIAVDADGHVHLAWSDARDGNKEIYYARRDWDAGSWETELRLTEYVRESNFPSIAVAPDGTVSLVWHDSRDGNFEIFYKMRRSEALAGVDVPRRDSMPPARLAVVPNPVHSSTEIRFSLVTSASPVLSIYDVAGRLVGRIQPGVMEPGRRKIDWDGTGTGGSRVAPGIYFLEISAEKQAASTKVIVLR
jgi:hypothetical protein